MSDFNALKDLFAQSKNIKDSEVGFNQDLPEGKYIVSVVGVELTVSATSKKNMAKWEFKVDPEEEYGNKHHWKYDILDDPKKMKRFLMDLEKFGFDLSEVEFEDLEEVFEEIAGEACVLILRQSKKPNADGNYAMWSSISMNFDDIDEEEYEDEE